MQHSNPATTTPFNRDRCQDYVVAHGLGEPTSDGYAAAEILYKAGSCYADIAFELIARGFVSEPVEEPGDL